MAILSPQTSCKHFKQIDVGSVDYSICLFKSHNALDVQMANFHLNSLGGGKDK